MGTRRNEKRNKRRIVAGHCPATRVRPLCACIQLLLSGGLAVAPLVHAELPQVLPGGRWQGALDPRIANGGLDMIINQTRKSATLDWRTFDIGANNSVRFEQPSADAVALNRIYDNDPSRINGRLQANGQVYLINRNGIVFGDNAQVDVNTLIASTLNIEDRVFEASILGAIQNGEAAFVAAADMPASAAIEVQRGARLSANQGAGGRILILAPNVVNRGSISTPDGQAVLAAAKDSVYLAQSGDPNLRGVLVEVKTGGTLDNIGSVVAERGNVSLLGMTVNQDGLVRATSSVSLNGSIRLVAGDNHGDDYVDDRIKNVRQAKGNFYTASGGTLNLRAGSVTEIVPQDSKPATDGQTQSRSYVDMAARNVTLESGARVKVTGGDVTIVASDAPKNSFPRFAPPVDGVGIRVEAGAEIDVSGDTSTVVPVSRNIVAVEARGNELADSPRQRNGAIRNKTLYVDVRKGTPFLNAAGAQGLIERGVGERFARGGTINLQSTGDVVVEDTAQLNIRGGHIRYTGDNVFTSKLVTEDGRVFDIAEADPDRVYVGVLGQDLVIDHAKWGMRQTFSGSAARYEAGYVEGKDAGVLSIQTRRLAFNGTVLAGSTVGDLQRLDPAAGLAADAIRAFDQRPHGGTLALDLSSTVPVTPFVFDNDAEREDDPRRDVPLANGQRVVLGTDMLAASGVSDVVVNTKGTIEIVAPITLADNGSLQLAAGRVDISDDIRIAGGDVLVKVEKRTGNPANGIVVPAEEVALRVDEGVRIDVSGRWTNDSPRLNPGLPTAAVVIDGGSINLASGGDLLLGRDSVLDVSAGAWLTGDGVLMTGAGGGIALASTDNVEAGKRPSKLEIGAELRGYSFYNGASLSLKANEFLIADQTRLDALLRETRADGSLRYALSGTGALRTLYDEASGESLVVVAPVLFQSGGFDSFALTATRSGLEVAAATRIDLDLQNRSADPTALAQYLMTDLASFAASAESGGSHPLAFVPTGAALDRFTRVAPLPAHQRSSVDLLLASENTFGLQVAVDYPLLSVGTGAEIFGRPGAEVVLASDTLLLMDGRIDTPAGKISLNLDSSFANYAPQQMIWLGPQAELSAAATTVLEPNELGLRQGQVLDAGTVSLNATLGSIVTAAGSRIAVDGTASTLDFQAIGGTTARRIAGHAGTIALTAAESILLQGGLSGRAADASSAGGALSVTLDPRARVTEEEEIGGYIEQPLRFPNDPRVINLAAYTGVLPTPAAALPTEVAGQAFLPADQVAQGGFDTLLLKATAPGSVQAVDAAQSNGIIRFTEDTALTLRARLVLDAPTIETTGADVDLSAAYVALGSTDTRYRLDGAATANGGTVNLDPTGGDGTLRVRADLIDLVGDTVLQGFGGVNEQPAAELASAGDIRLLGTRIANAKQWNGSLRAGGDLQLRAQQIYPTTLSSFELAVERNGGHIDVYGQNGTAGKPLSAGGSVTFNADNITVHNDAVVRAPLGEINFTGTAENTAGEVVGAQRIVLEDGSLLSVSAAGLTIPFGYMQFKKDLVLPISGESVTLQFVDQPAPDAPIEQALPQKRIRLAGDDIDVQPGAQFDLSGGGDVRATEFVPGPGGSKDILLADLDTDVGVIPNGSFAIVPNLGGAFAPYDPVESPAARDIQGIGVNDTLIIDEGIDGLPAGEYAILPARYALYGGYLVTPVAGTQDMQAGQNRTRLDGAPILVGRGGVAGTPIADSRVQGFAIEDGARVRQRAEYAESSLDTLFADAAVRTPHDAGNLTIDAGATLRLAGSLVPTAGAGRGSQVDIIADELSIVTRRSGNGVELLARDLAGLNADSLLIGGTRSLTEDGVLIDPSATRVEVEGGVDLDLRELILVADHLQLGEGATPTRLASSGAADGAADPLAIAGNAAVAMVSVERGATVTRTAGGAAASLDVADGVTLTSYGSMLLDAEGDVNLRGTLAADGGSLALGGASVSLGETDGRGLTGLVLSNADLARLAGSDLTLRSSGTVDIYGALGDRSADGYLFDRLALDAKGIVGRDNSGAIAYLAAAELELGNRSGSAAATVAGSGGELQLQARELTLAQGDFGIGGFDRTRVQADGTAVVRDSGTLDVNGDLILHAPLLTAAGGAERNITASGGVSVSGADAQAALPASAGLGAELRLEGTHIDFAGNVVLPSGEVTLAATGDIALNRGANIDVAGRDERFATKTVGTAGGDIAVRSQSGSVTVGDGVRLDVSGAAAGGEAGRIELSAPQGTLAIAPTAELRAADGERRRGEFVADAAILASTDAAIDNVLTSLNEQLEQGGFRGRRDLRVRSGDLELEAAQAMRAREVKLTADSGRLVVDGTIDASGSDGGSILLAAGDALEVNGRLDAHATTTDGDGGRIELAATDADGDDAAHNDGVDLNSNAVLDVRGGANGDGGSVLVRGLAYDSDNDGVQDRVAIGDLDAQVLGAERADVEAVHAVTDADGTISDAERDAWRNTLDQFMNNAAVNLPASWRLVPGLEISSAGDIRLTTDWDLYTGAEDNDVANDWRFGANNDVPLILTLRAGGNVRLDASLTDGFIADSFFIGSSEITYERLGTGRSTVYRVVAGADRNSADVLATGTASRDVQVAAGRKLRTGAGDIDLAASGNVDLGQDAAIYSAGRNAGLGSLANIDVNLDTLDNLVFLDNGDIVFGAATGEAFLLAYLNKGQFAEHGGDIRIEAKGNLVGQASDINVTDWQPRLGGDSGLTYVPFENLPAHWAIAFDNFMNGVGALGGGDVMARVGGDVQNVALALPTSGRPDTAEVITNDDSTLVFADEQAAPVVYGGGDLDLEIGGDLIGGAMQVDRGTGRVRSGGRIGDDGDTQPYFAVADTDLDIAADDGIDIGGVFNSTVLPQQRNLNAVAASDNAFLADGIYDPLFFTYSPDSRVSMTAVAGDITFQGSEIPNGGFDVYPASLHVLSLQGGIRIADDVDVRTYPSARGQLELLAEVDIQHLNPNGDNWLIQSDADPELLPSVANVLVRRTDDATEISEAIAQYLTPKDPTADGSASRGRYFHAATPVHSGDTGRNLIVARSGSLLGKASPTNVWELVLAKQTLISVGEDVRDMAVSIQQLSDTDISVIEAKGDIIETLSRNVNSGAFEAAKKKKFEIAGPGRLDVLAGGDIDLGTSVGVVSIGDTVNPALSDTGAGIVLMAGLAQGMDYDTFIKLYLQESSAYLKNLNAFLAARGVDPAGDPVGTFRRLSRDEQRKLILSIFFEELKDSGSAAKSTGSNDYSRGFKAIATLFPGQVKGMGNISTPVSVVKTVDGGQIDMLAPYGAINAGATFRAIEKKSDELGVIAARGGDINVLLDGDLQVNRERVFALQGDLVAWSTNGDIDAGKGAKTVISVPDPIVTVDANGNTIVTIPLAVDGSGLSASGNAYLFAPHGTINAGDAGIRVQGNLIVGAVEVLGADNIDVGGTAVGVPVAAAGVDAGVAEAGALSSNATSLAEEQTSSIGNGGEDNSGSDLGVLNVELLGFGDCAVGDTKCASSHGTDL